MIHLAVSVGCPCGIGPEISVRAAYALLDAHRDVSITLCGDGQALRDSAALHSLSLTRERLSVVPSSTLENIREFAGNPQPEHGSSQLAAIDAALAMVLDKRAHAMVTGPVSKHAISSAGIAFTGHTEYIAERTDTPTPVMSFLSPRLCTSLVTTHLPLRKIPDEITISKVTTVIGITARALWRELRVDQPRIVVCGLNPHAGEHGLLGDEEINVIAPAIEAAIDVLRGIATVTGPMGAESAFRHAKDGLFDAVVAMYHDQATIAAKLVDFGDSVNVTLGLPIVRTSVDHGTAYDLAYTGRADSKGMLKAMEMALTMARARVSAGI